MGVMLQVCGVIVCSCDVAMWFHTYHLSRTAHKKGVETAKKVCYLWFCMCVCVCVCVCVCIKERKLFS